jgi:transposase InsO family protein
LAEVTGSVASKVTDCGRSEARSGRCFELAPLNFVRIRIKGMDTPSVASLVDSGSELNVIRSDLVSELPLESIGEVSLKGVVGKPVNASLVRLCVRLDDDVLSAVDDIVLIFAVCSELNETCILSIPAVNNLNYSLNHKLAQNSPVVCKPNENDVNAENDANAFVVTRSQAKCLPSSYNVNDTSDVANNSVVQNVDRNSDNSFIDVDTVAIPTVKSEFGAVNAHDFAMEQQQDETLAPAWKLARLNKAGYFVKNEFLCRTEKRCGQALEVLCVPESRRQRVVKLAHDESHFGVRNTKVRIVTSGLWWPTMPADVKRWVTECRECQLRARKTWRDRVPIEGFKRDPQVWHYFYMDCTGPMMPNVNLRYNYVIVLIDSCSRYPFAYPLRSLSAKNIADALMCMFQITGIPAGMTLASDNASNFRAALTRELLSRLGISPVFSTPYHPVSIVERCIQTLKNTIAKMAYDHRDSWVNYLGPSLWAIRSTVNESIGCSPHLLVFGQLPRGPLAILAETWRGDNIVPPDISKSAEAYLEGLRVKLEAAQNYAADCHEREQSRHVRRYNLRAQYKQFEPGESCLILQPDSTSSHALRR